jgi:hypothetical protein
MSAEALPATPERPPATGGVIAAVAACGIASIALLAAALVFAHHWGLVTDGIVAGWAATTIAAARGVWLLMPGPAGGLSRLAVRIAGAAVLASVVVLLLAGVAWATGGDPASCGGG